MTEPVPAAPAASQTVAPAAAPTEPPSAAPAAVETPTTQPNTNGDKPMARSDEELVRLFDFWRAEEAAGRMTHEQVREAIHALSPEEQQQMRDAVARRDAERVAEADRRAAEARQAREAAERRAEEARQAREAAERRAQGALGNGQGGPAPDQPLVPPSGAPAPDRRSEATPPSQQGAGPTTSQSQPTQTDASAPVKASFRNVPVSGELAGLGVIHTPGAAYDVAFVQKSLAALRSVSA